VYFEVFIRIGELKEPIFEHF